jgi:hypothetical protein
MYAKHLLVPAKRLLNVPTERKLHVVLSDKPRLYRRLQLTHQEQEAVVTVSDESLRFRALGRVRVQGRLECRSDVGWENPHQSWF